MHKYISSIAICFDILTIMIIMIFNSLQPEINISVLAIHIRYIVISIDLYTIFINQYKNNFDTLEEYAYTL